MAAPLPFTEMIHSLWVMRVSWLGTEGRWRLWLGKVLGCDGDGRLAAMEHKAEIEQVAGHRLGSGCGCGFGCRFGFGC